LQILVSAGDLSKIRRKSLPFLNDVTGLGRNRAKKVGKKPESVGFEGGRRGRSGVERLSRAGEGVEKSFGGFSGLERALKKVSAASPGWRGV
jgi:hypothetical protein